MGKPTDELMVIMITNTAYLAVGLEDLVMDKDLVMLTAAKYGSHPMFFPTELII